jgi:hypothetical protein
MQTAGHGAVKVQIVEPLRYENEIQMRTATHGAAIGSPNVGPQERPKGEWVWRRHIPVNSVSRILNRPGSAVTIAPLWSCSA